MASKVSCICVGLIALLLAPALGQEAAAPAPPKQKPDPAEAMRQMAEGKLDPIEFMRLMGAKEEDILGLQLFSQALGADPETMMLMMMMGEKGKMNEDILGMMMFMKVLGGAGKQPLALLNGNALLIIEDGTVYRIDTQTMKVEGSVAYRAGKGTGGLAALLPLIMQQKAKAEGTGCMSNLKQLGVAVHMFAKDAGGVLPTEQWQDQLDPYVNKNRALYACPGADGKPLGYAINEAVLGARLADLKRPSETVLFFEPGPGHDLPFGGLDTVMGPPRHDGRVAVGFADGHVQLVSPEELRELLGRDPFK